jgi:hypothetical protein
MHKSLLVLILILLSACAVPQTQERDGGIGGTGTIAD